VAAARWSTVSGGNANGAYGDYSNVGGGQGCKAYSHFASIYGGAINRAGTSGDPTLNIARLAFIGGGYGNVVEGVGAVIGGGDHNTITANKATIGGGDHNEAAGLFATVPGGRLNQADGDYSFAAGRRALASHDGCFVWADHTDQDFESTDVDQFLIRAAGGVGIGDATFTPEASLHVDNYSQEPTAIFQLGYAPPYLSRSAVAISSSCNEMHSLSIRTVNNSVPDLSHASLWIENVGDGGRTFYAGDEPNDLTPFVITNDGDVGIGVPEPNSKLHVNGPVATKVTTLTGSGAVTILDDYSVILVDNSAQIELLLPLANTCKGREYTIKKISQTSAGSVRIWGDPGMGQWVEPSGDYFLTDMYDYVVLVSDGVDSWYIVGSN
jgi:hypothetical protein